MVCAVCNKESNNRRVCPYCFTPYPNDAPAGRQSMAQQRQSVGMQRPSGTGSKTPASGGLPAPVEAARVFVMKQTPLVRWTGVGIVIVLLIWAFTSGERTGPDLAPGSVPSNIIASPMQREEAMALIKRTRETALVEMQQDEVSVSYPAATFPVQPEGQIALAQQFARADELVEGRKRRIFFYAPTGRKFAQSDGVTGVTVMR